MIEKFNSSLYPREVIIKTAYAFTDNYYVHLDLKDSEYIIDIIPKNNMRESDDTAIKRELDNAIISQLARYTVASKTSHIRQLIMARAFASSMIIEKNDLPEYEAEYVPVSENILKDWFESNEK